MLNRRAIANGIIWLVVIAAFIAMFSRPPIAQPNTYHEFADGRTLFGIPNFWNVLSNLPFLIVGVLGLRVIWKGEYPGGLHSLRWSYGVFFFCLMQVVIR